MEQKQNNQSNPQQQPNSNPQKPQSQPDDQAKQIALRKMALLAKAMKQAK